jgi:hypothetical protein
MLFFLAGCDEEFPPYSEPEKVLQSDLLFVSDDTVSVHRSSTTGDYYFSSTMVLKVEVTNLHDDLLQGPARIDGRITLQSFSQIPRTLVVPLTRGDLRTPPVYQGTIAIPPGSKAEFSILWLPYATDGAVVFEGLPFTQVGSARFYGPIAFIGSAEVQLFERLQPVRSGSLEFSLVFKVETAP